MLKLMLKSGVIFKLRVELSYFVFCITLDMLSSSIVIGLSWLSFKSGLYFFYASLSM